MDVIFNNHLLTAKNSQRKDNSRYIWHKGSQDMTYRHSKSTSDHTHATTPPVDDQTCQWAWKYFYLFSIFIHLDNACHCKFLLFAKHFLQCTMNREIILFGSEPIFQDLWAIPSLGVIISTLTHVLICENTYIETVECIHVACSALQDECHCLIQLTKYMYDDNLYQHFTIWKLL